MGQHKYLFREIPCMAVFDYKLMPLVLSRNLTIPFYKNITKPLYEKLEPLYSKETNTAPKFFLKKNSIPASNQNFESNCQVWDYAGKKLQIYTSYFLLEQDSESFARIPVKEIDSSFYKDSPHEGEILEILEQIENVQKIEAKFKNHFTDISEYYSKLIKKRNLPDYIKTELRFSSAISLIFMTALPQIAFYKPNIMRVFGFPNDVCVISPNQRNINFDKLKKVEITTFLNKVFKLDEVTDTKVEINTEYLRQDLVKILQAIQKDTYSQEIAEDIEYLINTETIIGTPQ